MRWLLLAIGIMAALLFGCSGNGNHDQEIKQTVDDFVHALNDDPPAAFTLLSNDCKDKIAYIEFAAQLTFIRGFLGDGELKINDFKVTDDGDNQKKDKATADFKLGLVSEGEEIPLTLTFDETQPMRFIKEDGRWRFADCAGFTPSNAGSGEQGVDVGRATPVSPSAPLDLGVLEEQNDDPNLPGDFVDLEALYGGQYPDTASHLDQQIDYRSQGLPPAGGPHWGSSACQPDTAATQEFCGPVPPGFYDLPWEAESAVHNMEHGGVVVWYNTADPSTIDDLRSFGDEHAGSNLVITPYAEIDDETVAITSWTRRLTIPVAQYNRAALQEFFDANYCRFDPEGFCASNRSGV